MRSKTLESFGFEKFLCDSSRDVGKKSTSVLQQIRQVRKYPTHDKTDVLDEIWRTHRDLDPLPLEYLIFLYLIFLYLVLYI